MAGFWKINYPLDSDDTTLGTVDGTDTEELKTNPSDSNLALEDNEND